MRLLRRPLRRATIRQVVSRAETITIRPTMEVMDRNSVARNLGSAKFLIDRTKRNFVNVFGLIMARVAPTTPHALATSSH